MRQKVLLLLISASLVRFICSCCQDYEFYDYSEIIITANATVVNTDEKLRLDLVGKEYRYLSSVLKDLSFSSAQAISCDEGWGGMKHPIVEVSIVSDADFSPGVPAGTNLADLFTTEIWVATEGATAETNLSQLLNAGEPRDYHNLILPSRPQSEMTHRFTVRLEKSNGEVMTGNTEAVTFR